VVLEGVGSSEEVRVGEERWDERVGVRVGIRGKRGGGGKGTFVLCGWRKIGGMKGLGRSGERGVL
jgi:hypothetical protein